MDIRIQCLCIDTSDPARIASFWESALGWHRTWEEEDQVCLEPPEGSPEDGIAPDLIFLKVPEGKTVKNRLHLDLRPADQDAEVARLQALGARQVSIGQGDVSWVVMADPDGNEFDVLPAAAPGPTASWARRSRPPHRGRCSCLIHYHQHSARHNAMKSCGRDQTGGSRALCGTSWRSRVASPRYHCGEAP